MFNNWIDPIINWPRMIDFGLRVGNHIHYNEQKETVCLINLTIFINPFPKVIFNLG